MKKTLTFQKPSQLPTLGSSVAWLFPFTMVDSSLVGMPEEDSQTSPHQVKVKASDMLVATWGFYLHGGMDEQAERDRHNLMKVLFEYGKRHVIARLKEKGALDLEETIELTSWNTQTPCSFNPARIQEPNGTWIEVEIDALITQANRPSGLTTAGLRQFIIEKFDDEELEMLCFDHFRDVHHGFTSGMNKRQKVQLLFEYCEQNGQWNELLMVLRQMRPGQLDGY